MTEYQIRKKIKTEEKVSKYVNAVIESLHKGFRSITSKKLAINYLNTAYEELRNLINITILDQSHYENEKLLPLWDNLYWNIPSYLRHWNEKWSQDIINAMPELTDIVSRINDIHALSLEVKGAVFYTPQTNQVSEFKSRIRNTIKQEMEKMNSNYAYAMQLKSIFGKIPVYINAHIVRNQYGTEFVRCFYYLYGKIVKLSSIIAIMQSQENNK